MRGSICESPAASCPVAPRQCCQLFGLRLAQLPEILLILEKLLELWGRDGKRGGAVVSRHTAERAPGSTASSRRDVVM